MNTNTIPALYWMIVIGVLSGMFTLILYYIAMLIKEATNTLKEVKSTIQDSREIIRGTKKIVDDTSEIVSELKGSLGNIKNTIDEFNDVLTLPIKSVSSIIKRFIKE